MGGLIYNGELFAVSVYCLESDETIEYCLLAENGDAAIEFAKAQAVRDGHVPPFSTHSLYKSGSPDFLAGDPSDLFDEISGDETGT